MSTATRPAPQTAPTARPAAFACPRCGEGVPDLARWYPVAAPPGRLPAWRLRHRRADGTTCTIYAGPRLEGGER